MAFLILELSVILFAASLVALIPLRSLWVEIASHFMPQYAIGGALLIAGGLIFGAKPVVYPLALAGMLIGLWNIKPFLPKPSVVPALGTVRILQANVLMTNTETSKLEKLIREENPDIILIDEANSAFVAMLGRLRAEYPHQDAVTDDEGSFGIALASKIPLESLERRHFSHPQVPAHFFRIRMKTGVMNLLSLHVANPLRDFKIRNDDFDAIEKWAKDENFENLVLIGDMNITPFAHIYKEFTKSLSLRNAREGRDLLGTFPSWLPGFSRIAIDHVLHTGNIAVTEFRTAGKTGSDHLPTVTVLGLLP